MEDLSFANGIALSQNEDYFIVAETGGSKLWRYWLKGEKRGQKEIFAHTPGSPDNIKTTPDGNFIVGIVVPNIEGSDSFLKTLMCNPILAKVIVRLCCFVQAILETINKVIFIEALAIMNYRLGNTEYSGANLVQSYGLVVEYDNQGQVVQSWHSVDPMVSKICEGFLHNGYMYLGSPYNNLALRVPYN